MKDVTDIVIRHVVENDKRFWFTLDKHLTCAQFEKKVRDRQGYIILQNNVPKGILRYNLFWDNTPFCTLLYVDKEYRRKGFGKKLMKHWEDEMSSLGYIRVLVSTQADESAQNFYRSIGYVDSGSLNFPDQPAELFLRKELPTCR